MQIVVMIDNTPYDPFMGAMQQLKAAMLTHYAKEKELECTISYSKHFTWYVVEASEEIGSSLINHLSLRGCTDIHVYTTDDISADLIEFSHKGLFRVCRIKFEK